MRSSTAATSGFNVLDPGRRHAWRSTLGRYGEYQSGCHAGRRRHARFMAAASAAPKSGASWRLPPGRAKARVPFVVAGLEDMRDSFSLAMNWMSRPWERHFEAHRPAAPPRYPANQLRERRLGPPNRLCLTPTWLKRLCGRPSSLPHPSLLSPTASATGAGAAVETGAITSAPGPARTRRLAYLAGQRPRHHVDGELGQGHSFSTIWRRRTTAGLCRPAAGAGRPASGPADDAALGAAEPGRCIKRSGDRRLSGARFTRRSSPSLGRWLSSDMDADDDGVPEWRSERQMGYVAFPTFGHRAISGRKARTSARWRRPDLLAYLISPKPMRFARSPS